MVRKAFRGFLILFVHRFLEIAAISSFFELEICSLHLNGVEFHQKMNGIMFFKVVRHLRSEISTAFT